MLPLLLMSAQIALAGSQDFTVTPPSIAFKPVTVGTVGLAYTVTVQNVGTTGNVIIDSYSISPSEFQFFYGWSPVILVPGSLINYSIRFAPDAAQTFNGQFVLNIEGAQPIVIPLSGTGAPTSAKASISPSTLSFADTPEGKSSAGQDVTITNVGTSGTTVNTVTIDSPFQVAGFSQAVVLQPGKSVTVHVNLAGTLPGSYNNLLTVGYSNLNSNGVALSGNVGPAKNLGINTYPVLSSAVVGGAYLANLTAEGGVPPYTWSPAPGSSLPKGLSLSPAGSITGTLGPNVKLGNYFFTVSVADSAAHMANKRLTLPVMPQTGANCNSIFVNIPATSSPLVPINDLGTGTYQGSEGGLYPGGSNVRPPDFDAAGVAVAQTIQPLDADGNPDPVNGKIGVMSLGMSALFDTFLTFITDTYADPTVNPHIVLVPGAQPRAYAANFANPNDGFWNPIFQNFLPESGITAAQVQVVYFKDIDPSPHGTFPTDIAKLQSDYEAVANNVIAKFPNVKIMYMGGPIYTGYSIGLNNIYPEPYSYESAFAIKWTIQDQINGNPNLNWDATKGPVKAPWLSWGAYSWANGLLARNDGLTWSCPDIKYDGFHPSLPYGREKETNLMLNFFKSDDTAISWFLTH